jgi:type IV secretion system protein VirB8
MFGLSSKTKHTKKKSAETSSAGKSARASSDYSPSGERNWYADRYQTILVQRNFLILLSLIALTSVIISVLAVTKISTSKTIEPFVIEIDKKTGITNVIRPLIKEQFASDEILRRYFIVKYLRSREEYEPYSYKYNFYTVTRLFSSQSVYSRFRRSVSESGGPLQLGTTTTRTIRIKSMSYLEKHSSSRYTVQVRFSQDDTTKRGTTTTNKVATMTFDFIDARMTMGEREVNPLGFQVTSYQVDNETL